jgi:hypothetical protein
MNLATISNHLEQARRHVAEAQRHIGRQREMVAQLRHDRHDVSASEKLLDLFEQLYVMHLLIVTGWKSNWKTLRRSAPDTRPCKSASAKNASAQAINARECSMAARVAIIAPKL